MHNGVMAELADATDLKSVDIIVRVQVPLSPLDKLGIAWYNTYNRKPHFTLPQAFKNLVHIRSRKIRVKTVYGGDAFRIAVLPMGVGYTHADTLQNCKDFPLTNWE